MADNVAVTAGSGTSIGADEVVDATLGTVKVQFVKLMDGTLDGTTKAAVGANGLAVDVKDVTPGTGATDLGKAEDAAHSSGDTGVMMLAVRKDTAAALAGTDGDYAPLEVDANGALHIAPLPAGANAIGKLAANSGVDIGDVDVTSIAAGENVIGKVGASDIQVQVTPTMDTAAYTSGDVWFGATEIANAARTSGGVTILQSLTILDKDDQTAAAVDLYFFDRTVTLGTVNAAVSISDADAAYFQGHVAIAAADWKDLINSKVACKAGIGLAMKPNATSLFVAAVVTGTPTQTASGVVLNFTFLRS